MVLRKRLWDVAVDQHGFVTTVDARALGADPEELARLYRRGKLERAGHGIYRFPELPVSACDEYMLATLWPGVPDAALSHDTALAVHDLCDVNPDRIHLTIPAGRRVQRAGGEGYVVHRQNPRDVPWDHPRMDSPNLQRVVSAADLLESHDPRERRAALAILGPAAAVASAAAKVRYSPKDPDRRP